MTELNEISRNYSVVVCRPDKCQGVVIVDRVWCPQSKRTKFEPINEISIKYIFESKEQLHYLLGKLRTNGTITREFYVFFFISGSALSVLYG